MPPSPHTAHPPALPACRPLQGTRQSAITVVQRRANGDVVYQYDAQGQLLSAPDCHRKGADPTAFVVDMPPIRTSMQHSSPSKQAAALQQPQDFSPLTDQAHSPFGVYSQQDGYPRASPGMGPANGADDIYNRCAWGCTRTGALMEAT